MTSKDKTKLQGASAAYSDISATKEPGKGEKPTVILKCNEPFFYDLNFLSIKSRVIFPILHYEANTQTSAARIQASDISTKL